MTGLAGEIPALRCAVTTHPAESPRLGALLVAKQVITPQQLDAAIAQQQRDARPLGQILLAQQVLTENQLARALRRQNWLRQTLAASTLSFSCVTASCLNSANASEPERSGFQPDSAQIAKLVEAADSWHPGQRLNRSRDTRGEPRHEESRRRRFEQDVRESVGETMFVLLKGEYSGGVERYQDGLRYTAKWTDDSLNVEFKYYF